MKKLLTLSFLFVFFISYGQSILYVDSAASGLNDGSNWANAYTDLQDALSTALPGESIWVAKGTYTPSLDTNFQVPSNPAAKFFSLANDSVKVYGGFIGIETSLAQRNWRLNKCILSGKQLSGISSYTVFFSRGDSKISMLNGFYVQDGATSIVSTNAVVYGGGLTLFESSISLVNLVIRDNLSDEGATTITARPSKMSKPNLINVEIHNNGPFNPSFTGGGAIYVLYSDPVMINLDVHHNEGITQSAIHLSRSKAVIHNLTVEDNIVNGIMNAVGIKATGPSSDVKVYNSILRDGPSIANESSCTFYNSNVRFSGGSSNWNSTKGTDGGGNIDTITIFRTDSNDFRLASCAKEIDEGSNIYLPYDSLDLDDDGITNEPLPYDLSGLPRISNGTVDMGAYEYQAIPGDIDSSVYFICPHDTAIVIQNEVFADTGSYFRQYTSREGCDSLVRLTIEHYQVDTTISILPGDTSLAATASNATFQWLDCTTGLIVPGETDSILTGQPGNFAVIVTQNGCVDTSACFKVSGIGLPEYVPSLEASIFPNPSEGVFSVALENEVVMMNVRVLDLQGRVLLEESFRNVSEFRVDISHLPEGVFVLELEEDKMVKNQLRHLIKVYH